MKKISLVLICLFVVVACKKEKESTDEIKKESVVYASFGEKNNG